MPITFQEYSAGAQKTAVYPEPGGNWVYPAGALAGEVGEMWNKMAKRMRVAPIQGNRGDFSNEQRKELLKELGDVLWFLDRLCMELGSSLGSVAEENLAKLASRAERGTICGEGDER